MLNIITSLYKHDNKVSRFINKTFSPYALNSLGSANKTVLIYWLLKKIKIKQLKSVKVSFKSELLLQYWNRNATLVVHTPRVFPLVNKVLLTNPRQQKEWSLNNKASMIFAFSTGRCGFKPNETKSFIAGDTLIRAGLWFFTRFAKKFSPIKLGFMGANNRFFRYLNRLRPLKNRVLKYQFVGLTDRTRVAFNGCRLSHKPRKRYRHHSYQLTKVAQYTASTFKYGVRYFHASRPKTTFPKLPLLGVIIPGALDYKDYYQRVEHLHNNTAEIKEYQQLLIELKAAYNKNLTDPDFMASAKNRLANELLHEKIIHGEQVEAQALSEHHNNFFVHYKHSNLMAYDPEKSWVAAKRFLRQRDALDLHYQAKFNNFFNDCWYSIFPRTSTMTNNPIEVSVVAEEAPAAPILDVIIRPKVLIFESTDANVAQNVTLVYCNELHFFLSGFAHCYLLVFYSFLLFSFLYHIWVTLDLFYPYYTTDPIKKFLNFLIKGFKFFLKLISQL